MDVPKSAFSRVLPSSTTTVREQQRRDGASCSGLRQSPSMDFAATTEMEKKTALNNATDNVARTPKSDNNCVSLFWCVLENNRKQLKLIKPTVLLSNQIQQKKLCSSGEDKKSEEGAPTRNPPLLKSCFHPIGKDNSMKIEELIQHLPGSLPLLPDFDEHLDMEKSPEVFMIHKQKEQLYRIARKIKPRIRPRKVEYTSRMA